MGDQAVVTELAALDTATVSDALDRLGIATQVPGILPLTVTARLCGPAFTLRYEQVDSGGGTVGDFIDDVDPSSVLVLANGGRLDCTVWGDILTSAASRRGIQGTVIDGVCRDVAHSAALGYPVFSCGRWMRTGKDRVRLAEVGVQITIGGVRVDPGDILLGDGDGVVVIPLAHAERVVAAALEINCAEAAIRSAVERGERLDVVRRTVGYHALQTRASEAAP